MNLTSLAARVAVLYGISGAAFAAGPVPAIPDKGRVCTACHAVDQARMGPSFQDVAARYRKDKGAEARLTQKVLKGGGGVWNMPMGPMPAQAQLKEAEARDLVKWILALR